MTLSLAQLQQNFAQSLKYQTEAEDCDITSDKFNATERLQIYRNNFVMSLTEVLQATYPMLHTVLGEECFDAIARYYILSHPLSEGDVSRYGNHFDDVISHFPQVTVAAPYASDLTRFEWTLDKAQQTFGQSKEQSSSSLLPLETIHSLSKQQHSSVILHLAPWVFPFTTAFGLFALQRAFSVQNFDNIPLNQPQSGVIACNENGQPWAKELQHEEFQLLTNLYSKTPLGNIPQETLTGLPSLLSLNIVAGFSLVTPN